MAEASQHPAHHIDDNDNLHQIREVAHYRHHHVTQRAPHVVNHVPRKLLRLREDAEQQGQRDEQLHHHEEYLQDARQQQQDVFLLVNVHQFIPLDHQRFQSAIHSFQYELTQIADEAGRQQEQQHLHNNQEHRPSQACQLSLQTIVGMQFLYLY